MPKTADAGPVMGPTIAELAQAYRSSASTPTEVVDQVLSRIADRGDDGTWITVVDRSELEDARWFDRGEATLMIRREHPDGLAGPHPFAIAHHLLGRWVEKNSD